MISTASSGFTSHTSLRKWEFIRSFDSEIRFANRFTDPTPRNHSIAKVIKNNQVKTNKFHSCNNIDSKLIDNKPSETNLEQ
jgi:hypothetical protein